MGVGDPVSIVEAVALGVDMFDCVLPTRLARHGTILTADGRLNLRNAKYMPRPRAARPRRARCPTCARWSRAYLRHLLMVSEPTVARLTTIHNVHWLLRLMEAARAAIVAGTYDAFRRRWSTCGARRPPEGHLRFSSRCDVRWTGHRGAVLWPGLPPATPL